MCDFVCGTMSHAKSSLHWSVIILSDIQGVARKGLLITNIIHPAATESRKLVTVELQWLEHLWDHEN